MGEEIEILVNRTGRVTQTRNKLGKETSHTGILRKSTSGRRKAVGRDSEMGAHLDCSKAQQVGQCVQRRLNENDKILCGDLQANVKTLV